MATMVSSRYSASRGLFAWIVVRLPSCPVFIACSMSSASSPRTSPTMIRSGRMAKRVDHQLSLAALPLPSIFDGRVSSRHDVALPEHQLGCILDCDDAFGVADIPGQHVQECRLAGAHATRHDEVQSTGNGRFEKFEHWLRQRVARD